MLSGVKYNDVINIVKYPGTLIFDPSIQTEGDETTNGSVRDGAGGEFSFTSATYNDNVLLGIKNKTNEEIIVWEYHSFEDSINTDIDSTTVIDSMYFNIMFQYTDEVSNSEPIEFRAIAGSGVPNESNSDGTGADWEDYDTTNDWYGGNLFNAEGDILDTLHFNGGDREDVYIKIDLTAWAQAVIDGDSTNHGITISHSATDAGATNNDMNIYAKEIVTGKHPLYRHH